MPKYAVTYGLVVIVEADDEESAVERGFKQMAKHPATTRDGSMIRDLGCEDLLQIGDVLDVSD